MPLQQGIKMVQNPTAGNDDDHQQQWLHAVQQLQASSWTFGPIVAG